MALQNCMIIDMNSFLNNKLFIPDNQREYSWEQAELIDFWDDLDATKNDDEHNKHFFGQIVIYSNAQDNKKYIIDGQQRTVTSTIFMRTLQIFYEKIYKDSNTPEANYRQSDIASIHIGRYISESKNNLHLILGELDRDFFLKNIQLGTPLTIKKCQKKSQELMRKAFAYFYNRIDSMLSEYNDPEDKVLLLNEYFSAFAERFNVLYMEATTLGEAFTIFETLNARGKDLETADLLKNYIFSKFGNTNEAQKKWNSMINTLDRSDATKYIRHFWNSNQPFTREKELYRAISKSISTPRASRDLLNSLAEHADCYHGMTCPEDSSVFTGQRLISSLIALKTLKARSFYPLILAMKQAQADFSEAQIADVAAVLESYVFRNFTVCGKVANSAEVYFADIARRIYGGVLDSSEKICEEIRAAIVSDKEFSDAMDIWCGSKSTKETVRYIFREIHKYLDRNTEINIDNSAVHIEHIMPENNEQWNVPEEIHEAYLWRLGNLALLSGSLNISLSNKPFSEKRDTYRYSKIEPNTKIADNEQWTATEIEFRQKELRDYALKIWKK